jgi:hypothetical protein
MRKVDLYVAWVLGRSHQGYAGLPRIFVRRPWMPWLAWAAAGRPGLWLELETRDAESKASGPSM